MSVHCSCGGDHEPWQHPDTDPALRAHCPGCSGSVSHGTHIEPFQCPGLAAAQAAPLDVERLADWMMFHIPEYNRWMMTGWRETMRDEAVVLARQMLDAATSREASDE